MTGSTMPPQPIRLTPALEVALRDGGPIVALESSVFAQGLPIPANRQAAEGMIAAVQSRGAHPAIAAVVAGAPAFGLSDDELARFLRRDGVRKVSARDLAGAMLRGTDGATTVAATLALCARAGIRVFATGGIGGVHREPALDESADLLELSRVSAIVVCAGAKSILDLPGTLERLETLGVGVAGYRTDEFPGFFHQRTGLPVPLRIESPRDAVRLFLHERALGRPGALLVVQPPPAEMALSRTIVEEATNAALAEARRDGIRGAASTPFLLAAVERATEGASLRANLALLNENALLAAEIAVELTRAA